MTKRRLIKLLTTVLVLVALSLFGVGIQQNGSVSVPNLRTATQPGFYPVVSISDGDTLQARIGGKTETIRMIGIDTPETKDPRKPVQCFGKAASAETHRLLEGKAVRLEGDPTDSDRDKYHRLLRYVYLPDGTMVNEYLVKNGYAFAYTLFPFTKLEAFRGYERDAREHNRGLWGGCKVERSGEAQKTNDEPK